MLTFTLTPPPSVEARHISNTIPPTWFDQARMPFLEEVAVTSGPDCFWMVRHAAYDYRREIFHAAAVEILSTVQRIGETSATLYQEAWQHGKCAVTATVTMVLFDSATDTKAPISAAARALLASHLPATR